MNISCNNMNKTSICNIFPNAMTLESYIHQLINSSNIDSNTSNLDKQSFNKLDNHNRYFKIAEFCKTAFILPEEKKSDIPYIPLENIENLNSIQLNNVIQDRLDMIIHESLREKKYGHVNCLALGYRFKNTTSEADLRGSLEFESEFSNSLQSFVYKLQFKTLLQICGPMIFSHILSRPLFLPLENGCYMQVAGVNISSMMYTSTKNNIGAQKYGSIEIPRHKILYRLNNGPRIAKILKQFCRDFSKVNDHDDKVQLMKSCFDFDITQVVGYNTFLDNITTMISYLSNQIKSNSISVIFYRSFRKSSRKSDIATLQADNNSEMNVKKTRRGCRAGKRFRESKKIQTNTSKRLKRTLDTRNEISDENGITTVKDLLLQQLSSNVSHVLDVEKTKAKSQSTNDLSYGNMNSYNRNTFPSLSCNSDKSSLHVQVNNTNTDISIVEESIGNKSHPMNMKSSQTQPSELWVNANYTPISPEQDGKNDGTYFHMSREFVCKKKTNTLKRSREDTSSIINKQVSHLSQLSTSHKEVSHFIKTLILIYFPMDVFWGCRKNLSKFLSKIDIYISMNKGETMTLDQIMSGIVLSKLPWLHINDMNDMNDMNKNDLNTSTTLIASKVFYWIYKAIINVSLSSYFYITECEGCGSELFYFQKSIWSKIIRLGSNQIYQSFVPIETNLDNQISVSNTNSNRPSLSNQPKSISSWWKFSVTHENLLEKEREKQAIARIQRRNLFHKLSICIPMVRFVPKKESIRAITNMRVRQVSSSNMMRQLVVSAFHANSISNSNTNPNPNSILTSSIDLSSISMTQLYNCLNVLRQIYLKSPHLIGFGVLGMDEIYLKIKEYRTRLQSSSSSHTLVPKRQYYVAVMDLEKCYDFVHTNELYDLMKRILEEKKLNNDPKENYTFNNKANSKSNPSSYRIHKYSICHHIASMERIITKNIRYVTQSDEVLNFKGLLSTTSTTTSISNLL